MATFLTAGAVQSRKAAAEVAPAKAQLRSKVALSMYTDLPDGEIAIEEFERFAMDRLRGELLCWPATCSGRGLPLYSGHVLGEEWPSVRQAVGREVPPAAPPAAITCLLIKNSARGVCAAVLKGIDDLKVKGFRHDQMQVRPSTLRHSGQVAGRLVCAVPFRLPARPA